ncbi:MAG: HRDC domain-containing protein [Desulfatiglandales bacterium]
MTTDHPPALCPPFEWIDTPEGLSRTVGLLSVEPVIGFDLEADSLFHFQEKVCLLQFATPERVFLVDPLALDDLSPMAPLFGSEDIVKVLHGADYDLRSLDRDFDIHIKALFDTQIAARFLGLEETGLGNLLAARFDVQAEKKFQKKDWSVRPLPGDMLKYGAVDTAYLLELYRMLREELSELDRLSWVEEECLILSSVRYTPPDKEFLCLRLRGAGHLDSRGLAVAEELLRLRLDIARKKDRPPFKVFGNQPILEMARNRPTTPEQLCSVPGMSKGQVKALGPDLIRSIQKALRLPESELPTYPRYKSRRPGQDVMKRVEVLKAWREKRAAGLKLDPSVLFTNAQLLAISTARPWNTEDLAAIEGIRRWQQQAFGKEILEVMGQ